METDNLDNRTFELLFGVRRSVLYHSHRRRFYEIWNSVTVFIATVGGSSAIAMFSFSLPAMYSVIPSVIVAIAGALDLAVGTTRRANMHTGLAQRFITLEKRFASGVDLSDNEYAEVVAARLDIEADEPTVLRLLDVICHFQLHLSMGHNNKRMPAVPWWRLMLANWLSQVSYVRATICAGD